ncbi:MAG: radical SAM family heme chaperone HemW [Desulfobacterales bacterium]|nr:radical SAM family heme chaperone HemW [Desulfobacterales bacterium]
MFSFDTLFNKSSENYISNGNYSAGLYIHIPFCIHKCGYCDFYSITDTSLHDAYVHALLQEIQLYSHCPFVFNTCYFGGGTPSVISANKLIDILSHVLHSFSFTSSAEISIEINPKTVCLDQLKSYYDAGINRVSIGIQSFNNDNLCFLERIHQSKDGIDAIVWARKAGFHSIGIDLIYGLPNQTDKDWINDLETALNFSPEHISCYMLSLEPGTRLFDKHQRHEMDMLSQDQLQHLYLLTTEVLEAHGYEQYEISNFSKNKSTRCQHNLKYWSFAPYIGLGPSAHSFISNKRWWNPRNLLIYIEKLKLGQYPIENEESLDTEAQRIEMIDLRLRTREGLCLETFQTQFHEDFEKKYQTAIQTLTKHDYIKIQHGYCFLSTLGRVYADSITRMLLACE